MGRAAAVGMRAAHEVCVAGASYAAAGRYAFERMCLMGRAAAVGMRAAHERCVWQVHHMLLQGGMHVRGCVLWAGPLQSA